QRRIPYDMVRDLQRRADSPPPTDDSTPARISGGTAEQESVAARAELKALTVRSVPLCEHRELLMTALETARKRFLLAAPSVREGARTKHCGGGAGTRPQRCESPLRWRPLSARRP